VAGRLTVSPSQNLTLIVAGAGGSSAAGEDGGAGGFGGGNADGGNGGSGNGQVVIGGGGGGGASYISNGSSILAMAGGGGGSGGTDSTSKGGDADSPPAESGQNGVSFATGGQGGLAGQGGQGGSPGPSSSAGDPGTVYHGGNGGTSNAASTGGGGGGGGGGNGGGGGGGGTNDTGAGAGGGGANTPVGTSTLGTNLVIVTESDTATPPPVGATSNGSIFLYEILPQTTCLTSSVVPSQVFIGGGFSDIAVLSGGNNPTGTLTFTLYKGTCDQPIQTLQVPVSGNGSYSSGDFQPVFQAGTYQIVVTYSGDSFNSPSSTACGDRNQQLVVTKFTPCLTSRVPNKIVVEQCFRDTAILRGGFNPTGFLRFELFKLDTCSRAGRRALQTSSIPVQGAGKYRSKPFRVSKAGVYSIVATYTGDSNNERVSTDLCDPSETVLVESSWCFC
jgi:hypothetical protein